MIDDMVVQNLRRRGIPMCPSVAARHGERCMDAAAGETFVVEHVTEVVPGLWVAGMSACATMGGPRMGPIFGGMLLSGQRVAQRVLAAPPAGEVLLDACDRAGRSR